MQVHNDGNLGRVMLLGVGECSLSGYTECEMSVFKNSHCCADTGSECVNNSVCELSALYRCLDRLAA